MLNAGLDRAWHHEEPPEIRLRWTRTRTRDGVRIRDGELLSPDLDLPPESRLMRVRLIEPQGGDARALVVVLASWRDEDARMRTKLVGGAAHSGVAVLIPECPFYGNRRRVGQVGASLRYASDFVAMGRGAIKEARALLAWARSRYASVGVAGFSMGGQIAAMTAALSPWPIRVVSVAAATSPARVFFDGPLIADVRNAPLGEDGLTRLRSIMEGLDVLELPIPHDVRALLVGTRADAIVPPADTDAIARYWGVHPRWIDAGHVSLVLWRPHAMTQAVVDVFA